MNATPREPATRANRPRTDSRTGQTPPPRINPGRDAEPARLPHPRIGSGRTGEPARYPSASGLVPAPDDCESRIRFVPVSDEREGRPGSPSASGLVRMPDGHKNWPVPSRPPRDPYRLRSPCTEMSAVLRTISRNRGHPRRTVEDHGCATPERTTGTRPPPRRPPAPEPPGSPGTTAPAGSPFERACRPDGGCGPEHPGCG